MFQLGISEILIIGTLIVVPLIVLVIVFLVMSRKK